MKKYFYVVFWALFIYTTAQVIILFFPQDMGYLNVYLWGKQLEIYNMTVLSITFIIYWFVSFRIIAGKSKLRRFSKKILDPNNTEDINGLVGKKIYPTRENLRADLMQASTIIQILPKRSGDYFDGADGKKIATNYSVVAKLPNGKMFQLYAYMLYKYYDEIV